MFTNPDTLEYGVPTTVSILSMSVGDPIINLPITGDGWSPISPIHQDFEDLGMLIFFCQGFSSRWCGGFRSHGRTPRSPMTWTPWTPLTWARAPIPLGSPTGTLCLWWGAETVHGNLADCHADTAGLSQNAGHHRFFQLWKETSGSGLWTWDFWWFLVWDVEKNKPLFVRKVVHWGVPKYDVSIAKLRSCFETSWVKRHDYLQASGGCCTVIWPHGISVWDFSILVLFFVLKLRDQNGHIPPGDGLFCWISPINRPWTLEMVNK